MITQQVLKQGTRIYAKKILKAKSKYRREHTWTKSDIALKNKFYNF